MIQIINIKPQGNIFRRIKNAHTLLRNTFKVMKESENPELYQDVRNMAEVTQKILSNPSNDYPNKELNEIIKEASQIQDKVAQLNIQIPQNSKHISNIGESKKTKQVKRTNAIDKLNKN